jgi:guanylate kinase
MKLFPVVALIGKSGAGKSRLAYETHLRHPQAFNFITSYTTRPFRTEGLDAVTDPLIYHPPITPERVKEGVATGEFFYFVQFGETNGVPNLYTNSRRNIENALSERVGVIALVESAVPLFRNEGYDVVVVQVRPVNQKQAVTRNDASRVAADALRSQDPLRYDYRIDNDFNEGGLDQAVRELRTILDIEHGLKA